MMAKASLNLFYNLLAIILITNKGTTPWRIADRPIFSTMMGLSNHFIIC